MKSVGEVQNFYLSHCETQSGEETGVVQKELHIQSTDKNSYREVVEREVLGDEAGRRKWWKKNEYRRDWLGANATKR